MNFVYSIRIMGLGVCVSLLAHVVPAFIDRTSQALGLETGLVPLASAQEQKKTRKLPGISESVMKKLSVVTELVSPDEEKRPGAKPNFPQALEELRKMERSCKDKCNKYELSQIYRFFAFAHYSMDDYPKAIDSYKKVVAQSPEIPIAVELDALYSLSQLTYALDRFDEALKYLNGWMKLSTIVGADKFFLRGTIYYSKNDKKSALRDVNKAISMIEDRGRVPREQWYDLQRALYLEREDYRTAKKVLQKLIRHYPKIRYWTQFANVNGMLERENDQRNALDAVNVQNGLSKRQDYTNLAALYVAADAPFLAARVLESGMKNKHIERDVKNLKFLGNAWRIARESEKAIAVLSEAAKKASREDAANRNKKKYKPEEGNIYLDLVSIYIDVDNNKAAIDAGKKALRAGHLRRACEVHTNMGIAHTNLGQYNSAISSFDKAMEDKQCRALVTNWKRYAENEKRQKEELAKAF